MSALLTQHPVALGYLLNETLFALSPDSHKEDHVVEPMIKTQTPAAAVGKENPAAPAWRIQGKVGQKLAFFVMDPIQAFLSEASWLAFTKTLQALNQPLDEVTLFNLAQCASPEQAHALIREVQAIQMVGLGVQPQQWNIQPQLFPNVQFLWTSSFDEMLVDVEKKRTFWNQIKQFLGK